MKSTSVISAVLLMVIVATAFVVAVPVNDVISTKNDQTVEIRSRRNLDGVFDSIANGFEGLMVGFKKVGDSVMMAFNGIFSTNNKNALTDGFSKFGKGMRDGFNGLFGENGEKVSNGMKKVGDKIKGAFDSDDSSKTDSSPSDPSPASPPKEDIPSGGVPDEETT